MPVVYSTSFVRFHHDPVGATFETEWLEFANSEQLREALTEALSLARRLRVRGWVGNNTHLRTIRPVDQEWISEVWFPEFARLGVRRLAVVVPQDALARMGVQHILQVADEHTPFDTQYFHDATAARLWAAAAPALSAAA